MRIALISDCYAPRLGGIESQVHDLAVQLDRAGHEVLVVTATPVGPWAGASAEISDGIRVVRLATPLPGALPVNPMAGPALRKIMAGADVVHIHTGVVSPFAQHAVVLAARMDVPTTVTWHCILNHAHWAFRFLPVMQWAGRRGVVMNTVSKLMARQIQSVLGDSADVHVLYNGIDLSDWRDIAAERLADPPTGEGPLSIVSARRLAPRKRNDTLIRIAVAAQQRSGRDLSLTIFGEGPERAKLERLAQHLEAPWVKLAGRVDRAGLRRAYREADIYFSTSLMDSFGIATLEARTAGIPVVAPKGTGVEDFATHGVNALFGAGDRGLEDALVEVITDDRLRVELGNANARTVPSQDWESVTEATLAEYARAMAARPGHQR